MTDEDAAMTLFHFGRISRAARDPMNHPPHTSAPAERLRGEAGADSPMPRQGMCGVLQGKTGHEALPGSVPPLVQEVLHSPGLPLDQETRSLMEPRFGHDFSQVKVHTDGKAARSAGMVNAQAYTAGPQIVFGAGRYAPASHAGQALIAHELAHVVQQAGAPAAWPLVMDDSHEEEAESASSTFMTNPSRNRVKSIGRMHLARKTNEYTDARKQVLEELQRSMPSAILGILDSLDQKTKAKLSADPDVTQAIAKLPPQVQALVRKHLTAVQPADTIDPAAPVGKANAMGRAEFEHLMMQRYRVKDIHTGTFDEQKFGDMKESDWHVWHPGSSSSTYTWIVEGFQNFEKTFGGIPPVNKIVFFEVEYKQDSQGHAVPQPGILSSYWRGTLTIFKGITTSNYLRIAENDFIKPADAEAVHGNIAHELGHGISEISLDQTGTGPAGQDPQLYVDYQKAVGWTTTVPPQLYDIQAPGVKEALEKGAPPPAEARITQNTWLDAKLKERPLTVYMVDNPSDDFSEAVMAYVNHPDTLKKFSPARYKFIDERKAKWGPAAKQRLNIWEAAKKGGQPRTLQPAENPSPQGGIQKGME